MKRNDLQKLGAPCSILLALARSRAALPKGKKMTNLLRRPLIATLLFLFCPSWCLANIPSQESAKVLLRALGQDQQSGISGRNRSWHKLELEGFSITMPGKPAKEVATVDTPMGPTQMYSYTVEFGSEAYMVSFQDFPPSKWDFNGAGLDGLRKGYVKLGGRILEEREISMGRYKGREIAFTDKENRHFRVNAYMVEPRLYQVMYLTTGIIVDSERASKFLGSFVLDEGFAQASAEKRIALNSERLSQALASEFPQLSHDSILLLSKEILRRRLTPVEAGRFGWQVMTVGVPLLTQKDQEDLAQLKSETLSGLTTEEMAIYKLLYEKAASGTMTKEETEYARLLLNKAFNSLSSVNQTRYRLLMGEAIRLGLPRL